MKCEYGSYYHVIRVNNKHMNDPIDTVKNTIYHEKKIENQESEEVTYHDEKGYFVISYSNDRRGKNYKKETRYYDSVAHLDSWHLSYPNEIYSDNYNGNLNSYIRGLEKKKVVYTQTQDALGNTILERTDSKITFDKSGLIIRIEITGDGKVWDIEEYIRDSDGKLLYIESYTNLDRTPYANIYFTRITR